MNNLSNKQTVEMLINNPSLVKELDLTLFDGNDIALVLREQPSLVGEFDLTKLDGYNITRVLSEQPSLVGEFDLSKMDEYDITQTLCEQPSLVGELDVSKMDGFCTSVLLVRQPQFKEQFNCVIVPKCGRNNRTLFIVKDKPTIIHLGCFEGTREEAIRAIYNDDYYVTHREDRDAYISKVEECFALIEE